MRLDNYSQAEIAIIGQELQGVYGPYSTQDNEVEFANGDPSELEIQRALIKGTRNKVKNDIDSAAEKERGRYITLGAGQALVYGYKILQAERYLTALAAGEEIDENKYRLLACEVGITAPSLELVAQTVLAASQMLESIAVRIEVARLNAKKNIDAAETTQEIINIGKSVNFENI